jgi:hypothetical protein
MNKNANVGEENRSEPDAALRRKIAERAYHLWLESGCGHGDHERHWLQAERELMEAAKHKAKPPVDSRQRKKSASPH